MLRWALEAPQVSRSLIVGSLGIPVATFAHDLSIFKELENG